MPNKVGGNTPGSSALLCLKRDKEPRAIAEALVSAGWRLTVAASVESLIAIANAELPELLVVDASLPLLPDGRHPAEVLRSLGARGHRPKIVLVAKERDGRTLSLAAACGAAKVLVVAGAAAAAPEPGEGRRLWVVDDSPAIRLLVASAFERAGWRVSEFGDLGSALAARTDRDAPVAVLLDIHLPDGNGLDHVRRFTSAGASVVMLSNLAGPDQVERAFAAGASDIVAKPCDLRSLIARVERAIHWQAPAPGDQPPIAHDPAATEDPQAVFSTHWL